MATIDVNPVSLQNRYMTQRQKTALLNLRIAPELKEAATKAAEADQRSLTSLIEKLLTDYLKLKGYLPGGVQKRIFKGTDGKMYFQLVGLNDVVIAEGEVGSEETTGIAIRAADRSSE